MNITDGESTEKTTPPNNNNNNNNNNVHETEKRKMFREILTTKRCFL